MKTFAAMESNERSATLAIAPFLLVLSSIAVVVRVAAKNIQQRSWAVHDYFTFFAQVSSSSTI